MDPNPASVIRNALADPSSGSSGPFLNLVVVDVDTADMLRLLTELLLVAVAVVVGAEVLRLGVVSDVPMLFCCAAPGVFISRSASAADMTGFVCSPSLLLSPSWTCLRLVLESSCSVLVM